MVSLMVPLSLNFLFVYETPQRTARLLYLLGKGDGKNTEGDDDDDDNDDQPSKFPFLFELSSLNNLVPIFFTEPTKQFSLEVVLQTLHRKLQQPLQDAFVSPLC
jgi:hypothetical protein